MIKNQKQVGRVLQKVKKQGIRFWDNILFNAYFWPKPV